MNNQSNDLRVAQNLVARLARHVSTELDLHYDTIDPEIMADELACLRQAMKTLVKAGMQVPEVIPHVLGKAGTE